MFEGIIFGFLVFSVGYVAFMRVMARRADVLHGEFIRPDGHRPQPVSALAIVQRYLSGFRLPVRR